MDNGKKIIWWLTQENMESMGGDTTKPIFDRVPGYIKSQYELAYGRPTHGSLWIAKNKGLNVTHIDEEAVPGPEYHGIVLFAADEKYVMLLPGLLTDLDGVPIFQTSHRQVIDNLKAKIPIVPIKWSQNRKPNHTNPDKYSDRGVGEDHIVGICPMGYFLITWAAYKDEVDSRIPEAARMKSTRIVHTTPWGSDGFYGHADTEEEAKAIAEKLYEEKIFSCILPGVNPELVTAPQWAVETVGNSPLVFISWNKKDYYPAGTDREKAYKLVERLNKAHRPNVRTQDEDLVVCWHDHEKGEGCDYHIEIENALKLYGDEEQIPVDSPRRQWDTAGDSTDETHKEDTVFSPVNDLWVKNSNHQPFRIPFFHRLMRMTREELLEQTYEFRVPNPESSTGFDIYQGTASQVFRGFKGIKNGLFVTTFLLKSPALPQTVFVEEDDITGVQVRSVGSDENNIYTNVLIDSSCYFTGKYGQLPGKNPVQSFKESKGVLEFDDGHGLVELSIEQIDWMSETDQLALVGEEQS